MRSNIIDDDDDPSLLSIKFWSYVKSKSNTSRIPESVSYNCQFRNNVKDQTGLFNTVFSEQFSGSSKYNIPINHRNDPNINFAISHKEVRYLLPN